jgi:hypothetical protein
MRSRILEVTGVAILIAGIACGEPYLHLNPYDPDTPLTIVVTGPDSLFSLDEVGQYSAQITPAFPDSGVVWAADTVPILTPDTGYVLPGSTFLTAGGDGVFQSIDPPLEPATLRISVGASIGQIDTVVTTSLPPLYQTTVTVRTFQYRHTGYKSIVLTQRLVRIQLRCPDSHACSPVAAGGTWTIWVDGFDALGHQIAGLTKPTINPDTGVVVASFVSRDTTIARVAPNGRRVANVTALKSGTTWIVATHLSLLDSLQLVVP